jgi:tripartite-type tricarboxylate transporter receptor subunit TctC
MTVSRREILRIGAISGFSLLWSKASLSQTDIWPSRTITFINGAAPGSTIDFVARIVGESLAARLGKPVITENRPGASFNIATQGILRAPADGYTIGLAPITMSTNPALMDVGYDPLQDVTMVTQISSVPVVLIISAHRPWRTLKEFVDHARRQPSDITLGHGGHGTSGFLAANIFGRAAGTEFRMVPYRGTAPILTDMLSNSVDGTFTPVDGTIKGHIEKGSMRVLAVMQAARTPYLPEVPTTREQGFGPEVDFRSWHGLMVRSGTPQVIVDRLFAETTSIVRQPDVIRRLQEAGLEPAPSASTAEFKQFYLRELARMGALIRELGIKPQ